MGLGRERLRGSSVVGLIRHANERKLIRHIATSPRIPKEVM